MNREASSNTDHPHRAVAKLPPKRWLRWVVVGLGGVIILSAMLVLMLPTLLSTGIGKGLITDQINRLIQGQVQIQRMSLGWFSGQRLEGVTVRDPVTSTNVMLIKSVDLPGLSLWKLLTGSRKLGTIRVQEPVLDLTYSAAGFPALRVFQTRSTIQPTSHSPSTVTLPTDLSGQLELINGRLSFKYPQGHTELHDLNVWVDLASPQAFDGNFQSKTRHGQDVGSVNAHWTLRDFADLAGTLQLAQAKVQAQVQWIDLPVALLDQFTGSPEKWQALLGPSVTGNASIEGDGANLAAEISATSQQGLVQLKAQLTAQNNQSLLSLAPDSTLRWTITPAALQAWIRRGEEAKSPPVKLLEPVTLEVQLEKVRLAQKAGRIHPAASAGQITCSISDAMFEVEGELGQVLLRDTKGQIQLTGTSVQPVFKITLDSTAGSRDKAGKFTVAVELRDGLDAAGLWQPDKLTGLAQIAIRQWPTVLIDLVTQSDGLLSQALGATLDASLQAELKMDGHSGKPAGTLNLQLTTPHLQGEIQGQLSDQGLTIPGGSIMIYTAPPEIATSLLQRMAGQSRVMREVPWAKPATLFLNLGDCFIPLQGNLMNGLLANAALASHAIELMHLPPLESLALSDLGIQLAWDGPQRQMTAKLKTRMMAKLKNGIGVAAPVNLAIDSLKLTLPAETSDALSSIRIGGKLTVDALTITGDPRLDGVEIRELVLDLLDTSLAQGMDAKVTAAVRHQGKTGRILAHVKLTDLLTKPSQGPVFKIPARLDNLPVSLVDQFMGEPGKYTALLGDTFERLEVIDLSNTVEDRQDYGFSLLLQSERLSGALKGQFKPGHSAAMEEGSVLRLNLSRQQFPTFQKHWLTPEMDAQAFSLMEPLGLELLIRQATVRFAGAATSAATETPVTVGAIDPSRSVLSLGLTAQPTRFALPAQKMEVHVPEFKMDLSGNNLAGEQTLVVQSTYRGVVPSSTTAGYQAITGTLHSTIRGQSLFDTSGRLDVTHADLSTQIVASHLPVLLLETVSGQHGKLVSALGDTLNADIAVQIAPGQGGPVRVHLKSSNLEAHLAGSVDKDMNLTLREDAVLNLMVTRALAEQYLSGMNFLLRDAQSSRDPVRLTLLQQDFHLPLRQPGQAVKQMMVSGRLELGALRVRRGPGGELVGLLRLAGARIENREEFEAIFSPMTFKLSEGVLTSSDLWMDTGDLRIGSQSRVFLHGKPTTPWGEVLLAIPGDTVLVVPGTRGRIDPRTIYTLGAVGALHGLKPDLASLITRIVAPVAGRSMGGEAGVAVELGAAIFGAITDRSQSANQPQQAAWFSTAMWPNRPVLSMPTVPAPTEGSTVPADPASKPPAESSHPQTPPAPRPEEQLLRGLLQGLTQPRRDGEDRR